MRFGSFTFSPFDPPGARVFIAPRFGRIALSFGPLLAACAVLCVTAKSSSAQTLESFRFQVENDYFDFWLPSDERPDNQYTHGQIVRALFNVVPAWARGGRPECAQVDRSSVGSVRCVQLFGAVTQQIFTPIHDSPVPVPGDRPYAGSLVAETGRQIVDRRQAASLSVQLGTTGYPSGAEAAQKAFHRLVDQRRPLGWRYQVAAQPIVGLTYGRQYLVTPWSPKRAPLVALIAGASGIATTMQSGVTAHLEMRTGLRLPHPWMPSRAAVEKRFRGYLIAGAAEQWVARDLRLEGNSRYTTGLVTMRPFVFQTVWGLGGGTGDYFIEYRAVSRAREYETSPGWHRWGAITLIRGRP